MSKDHEAEAVAHMANQIRDEEDERVMAVLDKIAAREPESFATFLARMGDQPMTVGSVLMSEASYRDIVHLDTANTVADEMREALDNPHSMGAMVADTPCPDCGPCEEFSAESTKQAFETMAQRDIHLGPLLEVPEDVRDALFKMGRRSGKTRMVTELMRENLEAVLMVGHRAGMSRSTSEAVFQASYGPPETFDIQKFRAAAEALHNASVPLEEAKQRMMDAMEKLTHDQIPLVQRELKALVKNGPARPVNRAERRQAKKARRRA